MPLSPSELATLTILHGVELDQVGDLLGGCPIRELAEGEVLVTMHQPTGAMYMILDGRFSVHLEGGPQSEPVAFLEAGQTIGELSALDAMLASAHVVAAAPSRVMEVAADTFWNLVDASHAFSVNLLVLLAQRLRANNATVSTNIRLQSEYKRNAMVDALTGLYNRRWLSDMLPRFVGRFHRSEQPFTLLMVDIDHFKSVNDRFGHPAGDAVLVAVAHLLRTEVRPSDHVARFGGEEFAILLPDTTARAALGIAERLRAGVKLAAIKDQQDKLLPNVTISIGGAVLGGDLTTAPGMIAAADAALYQSKQNGRDRVTF